jgi:hypothetical protein
MTTVIRGIIDLVIADLIGPERLSDRGNARGRSADFKSAIFAG